MPGEYAPPAPCPSTPQDPAGPGTTAKHDRRPKGRVAGGAEINDLLLEFMRLTDAASKVSEAQRAARAGMKRQRLEHLRKRLKVVTVAMLVDWCGPRQVRSGDLINLMQDYVASGGSIERARKCQTSLR